jgi:hypothetical protein
MSGRYLDLARRAMRDEPTAENAPPAHPCLTCSQAADERTLYCPSCWDRRRVVLTFDPDRLRRHEARAARTAAALPERFCEACGFSSWRVTSRGDASCYACDLIREGRPLRCAACGGEEWCRDEHGRRACATCAGGDTTAAAPLAFARPEASSREVSEPGGAA